MECGDSVCIVAFARSFLGPSLSPLGHGWFFTASCLLEYWWEFARYLRIK